METKKCESDLENSDLSSTLLPLSDPSSYLEKMGVDEMLQRFSGEFGWWQFKQFMFTSLAWALNAFHTMVVVFADHEPAWRCTSQASYLPCPQNLCGLEPGSWGWIGGSTVSTVAEWGLVCGEKYKIGLVQSAFFAGSMVGAGIFGHLSDSFLGRKGSLIIVCTMNAAFGILTALSPTYWVYVALRFMTGFSTGGVGLCAFVLATEPVGPTKRGAVGMSTFYFFSIGTVILSIMAYFCRSWRSLYIIASFPSLIFLILVLPFISESPRWYLVHQKLSKAMEVMREIAKNNGNHIPDEISLILDCDNSEKIDHPTTEKAVSSSIVDVIRSPITRSRLVLTVLINFLSSIVYYGLSLNVVNLKINIHISVILNAVAEMPAYALTAILLKWYGRRPLAIGTMWFSGVFCVIGSLMMDIGGAMKVARLVCGVMGIFAMAATFDLLFIYTAELFPTVVRNAALGCVTQAGQMGAIAAPLVVVLGGQFPFAVFGFCGIVGGILAFYLPETLDRPLYDTMAGVESGESGKGGK